MEIKRYLLGIATILTIIGLASIVMAVPAVNIIRPNASESIGGNYNLVANVTPDTNNTITSVQFLYENVTHPGWNLIGTITPSGNIYSLLWNTTLYPNGQYQFNVTAKDNNGTENSKSIAFSILNKINILPVVSVNYPGENVTGSVNLNAIASDPDGSIAYVTFYYSNSSTWNLIGNNNSFSGNTFTRNWPTSGIPNGDKYQIKAIAFDDQGGWAENISSAFRILNDHTPPNQVTNLNASEIGKNYINWTWSDPKDSDFSYVMVYLNTSTGANSINTTVPNNTKYFNSSGKVNLNSNTEYRFSIITVDASGNVNNTPVYNNSATLPNTLTGNNIIVDLPGGVTVTFHNVTSPGNTSNNFIPPANIITGNQFNIAGNAYDITTTAIFDFAEIKMKFNSSNPSRVKLYHLENTVWKDVTKDRDIGTSSVIGNVSNFSWFVPGDVPMPKQTSISPSTSNPPPTIEGQPAAFTINFDQPVNVTWFIDSNQIGGSTNNVTSANFTYNLSKGSWNVTARWENQNGNSSFTWKCNVRSVTYYTGNRIWDGSKPNDFALNYTWTPQSFSGFYYDSKDDVGGEYIQITLSGYNPGSVIKKNDVVYSTLPNEVSFTRKQFGKYQVVGFMADRYFAGYKNHTIPGPTSSFDDVSALSQGELHKVLIDEDTQRTISVGGTLALKDGYVLKATDIDLNQRSMFLVLLKDGTEVDSTPLSANQTYVYTKRVGNVENLPLILARFDNVFSGREVQTAFIKGIFQISEDVTAVKSGNQFGRMSVTGISKDRIEMKNSNGDIGLNKGGIIDLMGDLKIIVADNNSVLRFALSVDRAGSFEVRSTVFRETDIPPITKWTPYNFGMNIGKTSLGFYYNLDDGLGNETLSIPNPNARRILDNTLVYSTEPDQVSFNYDPFGKYQVIGFMADKYFAGYKGHTIPGPTNSFGEISAISQGELHKILIDDDTQRTISVGGTLALQDGYVLKATDIDLNARTMLLSLLKDGNEVDSSPLAKDETYVYKKSTGSVSDLPIIMVRFNNVFSGGEIQAAFLKGIFQISETATTVKIGNQYGKMEVTTVNANGITMRNDGDIGLDKNKNDVLMGNIRLKVADSDTLRFYFAVDVTDQMKNTQLVINAPAKIMAGDTIKINVTAGGNPAGNASLILDTDLGTTNTYGILNYTLPRSLKAGTYIISATKTGYEKATKNIEIEKYVDYTLSIEAPSKSNQYETIKIKVLYNGTAMSGAGVLFDNTSIGTSDTNGELSYKLETSGTHSITASKTSYISVSRDIDIRAPYSEFKALDINIAPNPVFTNDDFIIKSNITNVGTKKDTTAVDLVINGTVVDNRSVTLDAGERVEINFTRQYAKVENVTVEIIGQNNLLVVQQKPTNWLMIAAIATVIGAVIIYVLTSKGLLSLEILKGKFEELSHKFKK